MNRPHTIDPGTIIREAGDWLAVHEQEIPAELWRVVYLAQDQLTEIEELRRRLFTMQHEQDYGAPNPTPRGPAPRGGR